MTVKRNAALGFIFITVLIDIIGIGVIVPVIPALIEKLIHNNLSEASKIGGLLMFAYAFMQFIFSPVLGGLSDMYGRRPVLLISLFGLGINYIFHAFAPSIGWLFVGRIIAGIAGGSVTTATAYIADVSTPEKKAQNFGLIGAAFGLGFIIGPVIGGLSSQWGIRAPFLISAGLAFLNVVYGYFVLPESLIPENRRKFLWKRANPVGSLMHLKKYPIISGLVVSIFLVYLAGQSVQTIWSFYTMEKFHWSSKLVGLSLGFVGLLVASIQGGLIRIVLPLLGHKNSIYLGLVFSVVGLILISFASKGWMIFAFIVPYCLGGIAGSAIQGIISNQVPSGEQGELQGALTSLISLTAIIGPVLMTRLFAHFTSASSSVFFPGAPFIMSAICVILSLGFSIKPLKAYHAVNKSKQTVLPVLLILGWRVIFALGILQAI
jgi:DHA1 family tetracycline resistance protein-like MFS transporter